MYESVDQYLRSLPISITVKALTSDIVECSVCNSLLRLAIFYEYNSCLNIRTSGKIKKTYCRCIDNKS